MGGKLLRPVVQYLFQPHPKTIPPLSFHLSVLLQDLRLQRGRFPAKGISIPDLFQFGP